MCVAPDGFFQPFIAPIERDIHSVPNRIREAMNDALISIGVRAGDVLAERALRAAHNIGPVEIDHVETDCKTRDAVTYIEKGRARVKPAASAKKSAKSRRAAVT